jgi:hypothetical protein
LSNLVIYIGWYPFYKKILDVGTKSLAMFVVGVFLMQAMTKRKGGR